MNQYGLLTCDANNPQHTWLRSLYIFPDITICHATSDEGQNILLVQRDTCGTIDEEAEQHIRLVKRDTCGTTDEEQHIRLV